MKRKSRRRGRGNLLLAVLAAVVLATLIVGPQAKRVVDPAQQAFLSWMEATGRAD